ncbi:MAG: hypothetical protein IT521_01595 [Burkholderiales bacterium]|nr:hypothetical protein [Burkholderiales bacterium]
MKDAVVRVAAAIATLLALALLATVVAHWGWQIMGPRPVHIVPAAPADPVAAIVASGLWSTPGPAAPPAAPVDDRATLATGDTRLLGVFAERDGAGYALFRLPSGSRLVATGQEIAQGATLVAVRPDGITVRDAGGEHRIALRAEPAARTAPVRPVAAKSARSAACAPPAGFRGSVLRLNAELFQGIIAKPESWTALLVAERGALAVRDDSGFVTMLAMQKGDRLEQANGVALTVPDDVVRAVLKPLAAQQPVRVSGSRNGSPREWLLLNAGSCP